MTKKYKNEVGQKYYNLELSFPIFPDNVGLEQTTSLFFSQVYFFPKNLAKNYSATYTDFIFEIVFLSFTLVLIITRQAFIPLVKNYKEFKPFEMSLAASLTTSSFDMIFLCLTHSLYAETTVMW